ncbi:MAG: hypothetical protein H6Q67_1351 [Firmicutes bacterium]|nr:hypothetical protein [Bacillota bacterium]
MKKMAWLFVILFALSLSTTVNAYCSQSPTGLATIQINFDPPPPDPNEPPPPPKHHKPVPPPPDRDW